VLDSLRQPLETGNITVSRAALHVTYPARVQLIAAMNPCRCGHLADASLACARAPKCAADYQGRVSGPLFDRIGYLSSRCAIVRDVLRLNHARFA
jgi:magnesium chelatase family protein